MTRFTIRRVESVGLIDIFMLFAIGTILVTRLYLYLTGYPQVGGGVLHIAHAVWGGLFMALAIMAGLVLLLSSARPWIAVVGGIGFGLFIDELGKFITADVDYFFRPTAALIYATFVVLYLGVRVLVARPRMRDREWLANAAALAAEDHDGAIPASRHARIEHMLRMAPAGHPLTQALQQYLDTAVVAEDPRPSVVTRVWQRIYRLYAGVVTTRVFTVGLAVVAVVLALSALSAILTLIVAPGDLAEAEQGGNGFVQWAATISSLVSGVLTVVGVVRLPRSRLAAYRWFERALLVNIFLTQIFMFAEEEFAAATGMIVSLLALAALRILIRAEIRREAGVPAVPDEATVAA